VSHHLDTTRATNAKVAITKGLSDVPLPRVTTAERANRVALIQSNGKELEEIRGTTIRKDIDHA